MVGILRNIITVLMVVLFVVTIYAPAPLKFVLRRTFYTPDYECVAEPQTRIVRGDNFTLYTEPNNDDARVASSAKSAPSTAHSASAEHASGRGASKNQRLAGDLGGSGGDSRSPKFRSVIIVVVGGAFVFNNMRTHYGLTNELWRRLRAHHDLMLVAYPVRFRSSLRDAMLSLNETLTYARDHYVERHLVAVSAGALLAGTFVRKEQDSNYARIIRVPKIGLHFDSFVGICGVYRTTFDLELVDAAFKFYVLRGTPNGAKYTSLGLNLPTLLVTSLGDFLYSQSMRFAQLQECELLAFEDPNLPHAFVQMIHLSESQQAIERVCAFIESNRRGASVSGFPPDSVGVAS